LIRSPSVDLPVVVVRDDFREKLQRNGSVKREKNLRVGAFFS